MSTRDEILKFRHEYTGRHGTENSSTLSYVGQTLGLQEARLLAVALLLDIEPEVLLPVLDSLVWDSDLSPQALSTARGDLRPQTATWPKDYWESFGPVGDDFATPSDMVKLNSLALAAFLAALKAPLPLADALRRAFERRALLLRLAEGEVEFASGEVRPATAVFRDIRGRTQVSAESEDVEEMDLPKRTPEQRAELNAAIQKVAESFPPRAADDFDAIAAALEAMWKKK
jgi:hypothetical protein